MFYGPKNYYPVGKTHLILFQVTIPPWPVFRVRKDLVWQKPLPTMTDTDTTKPAAKKIKAKKDN